MQDYLACHTACNNFILADYSQGWDICYHLAIQEGRQPACSFLSSTVQHRPRIFDSTAGPGIICSSVLASIQN